MGWLERARAKRPVRIIAQVLIVACLGYAVIGTTNQADKVTHLQSKSDRADATSDVVTSILADTCGAANFKQLKRNGLIDECRLARKGQIQDEIKSQLPANNSPGAVTLPSTTAPTDLDGAVANWFATHNLSLTPGYADALRQSVVSTLRQNPALRGANGKDATPQQIAAAVSAYLVANPPTPGANGRSIVSAALDGCNVVFTYSDGNTDRVGPVCGKDGKDGTDAPPPTDEQVNTAVAAYCSTDNRCKGDKGDKGDPGYPETITLADGQRCTDPDGDHNYTCHLVAP